MKFLFVVCKYFSDPANSHALFGTVGRTVGVCREQSRAVRVGGGTQLTERSAWSVTTLGGRDSPCLWPLRRENGIFRKFYPKNKHFHDDPCAVPRWENLSLVCPRAKLSGKIPWLSLGAKKFLLLSARARVF